MATKQKEIETRYNKPLRDVLRDLYKKHGTQRGVASELGVGQGTVCLWFKHEGLATRRTVEEKEAKVS